MIRNKSFKVRICDPRYESRIRSVGYQSNLFGVRICSHDTVRIHGFAKRIHVFISITFGGAIEKQDKRVQKKTFLIWDWKIVLLQDQVCTFVSSRQNRKTRNSKENTTYCITYFLVNGQSLQKDNNKIKTGFLVTLQYQQI
jgi:hypothetical protein